VRYSLERSPETDGAWRRKQAELNPAPAGALRSTKPQPSSVRLVPGLPTDPSPRGHPGTPEGALGGPRPATHETVSGRRSEGSGSSPVRLPPVGATGQQQGPANAKGPNDACPSKAGISLGLGSGDQRAVSRPATANSPAAESLRPSPRELPGTSDKPGGGPLVGAHGEFCRCTPWCKWEMFGHAPSCGCREREHRKVSVEEWNRGRK